MTDRKSTQTYAAVKDGNALGVTQDNYLGAFNFWITVAVISTFCLVNGFFSGFNSDFSNQNYLALKKAPWQPPNWVFGPVWTILYTIMGFSLALILTIPNCTLMLNLFVIQLLLNFIWTPLFINAKALKLSLAVIFTLWLVLIALCWLGFYSTVGGLLGWSYVPYICWITLATSLNAYIAFAN